LHVNQRIASKPPIAGEPIITARTTIIPKTTPTMINRLFIPKLSITQIKSDGSELGKELEEGFKGKITSL
jgi:hypothetical protein